VKGKKRREAGRKLGEWEQSSERTFQKKLEREQAGRLWRRAESGLNRLLKDFLHPTFCFVTIFVYSYSEDLWVHGKTSVISGKTG